MEIELARITFHGFCIKSFEPGRAWKPDENGKLYTNEPQVIFKGQTAEEKLLNELRAGVTVFEFGKLEKTSSFSLIHHKESEQKDFICVCSKSPGSRAEPNSNQTSKRQTSADHYNLMYYQILYF